MKKIWVLHLFICLAFFAFFSQSIQANDAVELLNSIYARQGLGEDSFVLDLDMSSQSAKGIQAAQIRVYLHQTKKQMVTFLEPVRLQDQSILVIGTNTWMFQKGLNRPLRISAQQKLFGDAGIAETVGIDYLHDYNVENMQEIDGYSVLKLRAIDGSIAYQGAELWISEATATIHKVILSGSNGQPLKELVYSDYQVLNGHEVATIEISNLLYEREQRTILTYRAITGRQLAESAFDPLMMGQFELLVR